MQQRRVRDDRQLEANVFYSSFTETPKGRRSSRRAQGLLISLFSGALGAITALISRTAFDFTTRSNLSYSGFHAVSDAIYGLLLRRHHSDHISFHQWLSLKTSSEPLLATVQNVCGMSTAWVCVFDQGVRLLLIVTFFILGVIQIKIYIKALRMLPSSVEATAAIFASNFLLSGLVGAILFKEWANRTQFGVTLWIVGAVVMVIGVAVISTSPSPKVKKTYPSDQHKIA